MAASIKLKEGAVCSEDDIRSFCKGRIADLKILHYIKFVDSFPMKVTGKIQKFQDEGNIPTGMGSGFGRQDRDGVVHESGHLCATVEGARGTNDSGDGGEWRADEATKA